MNIRLVLFALLIAPLAIAQETPFFVEDVWPIFTENCIKCHGERNQEGDLRLDSPDGIRTGGEFGKIVAPGNADDSVMYELVSGISDERMPPQGDPLSDEKIATIKAWIASGAEFDGWKPELTAIANSAATDKHWAFKKPERPTVPPAKAHPIDAFVHERLSAENLAPAPRADRATLIRRLALDLTGLPPTPEDVDRMLAMPEDAWYAAWREELLASPHYGERWARHGLDAAQYADSDGFEKDKPRSVYFWRDWVVSALNNDMPYDQFVIEQIAGDLLPNATQDQKVATGFLRNSMINEEGGIHPEQFRMEAMFNRMDLIGRAVLGLTVGCAQCHDHKYDPLSHRDYFRMMAFINNSHEAQITVHTPEERKTHREVLKAIRSLEKMALAANPERAPFEESLLAEPQPDWEVLEFEFDDTSAGGQRHMPQGDGSYLAAGYAPTRFAPKMTTVPKTKRITALRLELLPDKNLPRGGPGRSMYGTSALTDIQLRWDSVEREIREYGKWNKVEFGSAIADVNPAKHELGPEWPVRGDRKKWTGGVEYAIDGKSDTAWTTDNGPLRRNTRREAIFVLKEPLELPADTQIAISLMQQHGGYNSNNNQNYNIGRFRISVTDSDDLPDQIVPRRVRQALTKTQPSAGQRKALDRYWLANAPETTELRTKLDELWWKLPNGDTQLTYMERPEPRDTHLLDRGDYLSPLEEVEAGVPDFLHDFNETGEPKRLEFARWLASPDSPTTARTIVNRVWQQYFGTGLVSTSADFGLQGEQPSHPEMLDWLALEFVDSGWSLKELHRLITDSETYKQSSQINSGLLERDPHNRLLARATRLRVEGEVVRDIALASSGLLDTTLGGPSVYPPAPEYLFQPPASYGEKVWLQGEDSQTYRRGLYTFRFRSVPYPVLQIFDAPAGNAPCTRRDVSNTPLQALATLNEPLFNEAAAALGARAMVQDGSDSARVAYAFKSVVSREPEYEETAALVKFLNRQRFRIGAGSVDAEALVSSGDQLNERAAWALTVRVILNLDETITRQ